MRRWRKSGEGGRADPELDLLTGAQKMRVLILKAGSRSPRENRRSGSPDAADRQDGPYLRGLGEIHAVREQIGARFVHPKLGVLRVGSNICGRDLGIRQRDRNTGRVCHLDGRPLGVGGEECDSGGVGASGPGGSSRAVNICTTRVIPEIMRISHILKTIKQPL